MDVLKTFEEIKATEVAKNNPKTITFLSKHFDHLSTQAEEQITSLDIGEIRDIWGERNSVNGIILNFSDTCDLYYELYEEANKNGLSFTWGEDPNGPCCLKFYDAENSPYYKSNIIEILKEDLNYHHDQIQTWIKNLDDKDKEYLIVNKII